MCWINEWINDIWARAWAALFLTAPHGWFLVGIPYVGVSPLYRWDKQGAKERRVRLEVTQGEAEEGMGLRASCLFWVLSLLSSVCTPPFAMQDSVFTSCGACSYAPRQREDTLCSALENPSPVTMKCWLRYITVMSSSVNLPKSELQEMKDQVH